MQHMPKTDHLGFLRSLISNLITKLITEKPINQYLFIGYRILLFSNQTCQKSDHFGISRSPISDPTQNSSPVIPSKFITDQSIIDFDISSILVKPGVYTIGIWIDDGGKDFLVTNYAIFYN